jgi:hypothetical protein
MIKYSIIKNGIITNSWTSDFADETHYEACFGLPERWVLHKDEPFAEAYDDADVLEEEMRDTLDGVTQKWVKLKAEYSIEIIDLDQDPEYLLQQCHAKRQAEYPSLGEFADAFVKMQNGDASQMEAYVAACLAVKAKHPKP